MPRRSLFEGRGTVGKIKGGSKLADYVSASHNQAIASDLKPRRSSRLRKITVIYESEATELANLGSKHPEICTYACSSPTKQAKTEISLNKSVHSPPKQNKDVPDVTDTDDEDTVDITLRDLRTRYRTKKRKAYDDDEQVKVDMYEHKIAIKVPKEDPEQEDTVSSKEKKMKSSSNAKLNRITNSVFHPSPVEMQSFYLDSAAHEVDLGEATIRETNFDEILADSVVGLRHKIEGLNGKMKEFSEQTSLSLESPNSAFDIDKEVETQLGKSDNENCTMNSTSALVNKCDFDDKSLEEGLNNATKREDMEKLGSAMGNMMEIKLGNLSTELLEKEKDGHHELQIEESAQFDKEAIHLIAVESSSEFIKSDCENLTCSLDNDRWSDEGRKHTLSDIPYSKKIIPLVSEYKISSSFDVINGSITDSDASLSTENHAGFVDRVKQDNMVRNRSFGAIDSREILHTVRDGEYNMVYENYSEQLREPLKSASSCITNISQMDCKILHNNEVVLIDGCTNTEAEGSFVSTCCEDGKQSSHNDGDYYCHFNRKYYLFDADGCTGQPDKMLLSSQVNMLSRCLERTPCCLNMSDLTNIVESSGQITCHFPVSQPNEIDISTMDLLDNGLLTSASSIDNSADLPSNSLLEPTKIYVERKINNIQTTEIRATDMKFEGNQRMDLEHSTKKLLSNRKEISPTSQKNLIRALNNYGLDDVVKLSSSMQKLCFDKRVAKKPLSSFLDDEEIFHESEQIVKKPKTMNQYLPEVTKGILKSPFSSYSNPCCLNSSVHAQTHDAILFSQRQMQDTENIASKLLQGLNSLKCIVEETLFSASSPFESNFNFDEIRLATKHASKLEVTAKKWLAMMAKDCTRFCKIMRLAENKFASPLSENKLASPQCDMQKGRKKISFADEAGGTLCHVKVYEQQPVAFIVPKS